VESRTSLALQEMFEAHQPSAWCFGHFHVKREFLIGETKFRCLAGMAISQVSEVFSAPEGIRRGEQGTQAFSSSAPCLLIGSK
jgi:hypothetical protein